MPAGVNLAQAEHWSSSARLVAYRDSKAAQAHMAETGCSPAGLKIMLRKALPIAIRVDGVPLKAAIIIKQEALSIGGDAAYSIDVAGLKSDHTDLVLLLSHSHMGRFIEKLGMQPFGLKKLALVLESLDDARLSRKPLLLRDRLLPMGVRTYIMGILNVTPDSFSDGGKHHKAEDAIAHSLRMLEEGADIIDIGGESTRPGSAAVSAEEELKRVIGVVQYLAEKTDAIISVDTMKPEVAKASLDEGAHIINDVSALAQGTRIAELTAPFKAGLVLMHMRGTPADMMQHTEYADVVKDVSSEILERAAQAIEAGANESSIILDPGFGFSKTPEQNIELLMRLREFANLGYPVLAGLSRKSTIGKLTGIKDASLRMPGSLAALTAAILAGADIVRVHDVAESAQAAKVADALRA